MDVPGTRYGTLGPQIKKEKKSKKPGVTQEEPSKAPRSRQPIIFEHSAKVPTGSRLALGWLRSPCRASYPTGYSSNVLSQFLIPSLLCAPPSVIFSHFFLTCLLIFIRRYIPSPFPDTRVAAAPCNQDLVSRKQSNKQFLAWSLFFLFLTSAYMHTPYTIHHTPYTHTMYARFITTKYVCTVPLEPGPGLCVMETGDWKPDDLCTQYILVLLVLCRYVRVCVYWWSNTRF